MNEKIELAGSSPAGNLKCVWLIFFSDVFNWFKICKTLFWLNHFNGLVCHFDGHPVELNSMEKIDKIAVNVKDIQNLTF